MIEIGKYNHLEVVKRTSIGIFLSDGGKEVLLPARYVPEEVTIGQELDVFIYQDNENRPIATTLKPLAIVGEFACLTVKDSNDVGAFLDWGLPKDLFVPHNEQNVKMKKGYHYIVYIYVDESSGRITASSKWNKFTDNSSVGIQEGDAVQLLIAEQSDLGYNAVINNKYAGLLYANELFERIKTGDIKQGFIKLIREDGKIDVSLQQQGYRHIEDSKDLILEQLEAHHGVLPLGDKSSPEEIYRALKISKKAFKKTLGGLFKERLITISDYEIRLVDQLGD